MASSPTAPLQQRSRPHALVVPAAPPGHSISCMRLARALFGVGFDASFVYFSSKLDAGRRSALAAAQSERQNGSPPSSDAPPSTQLHAFLGNDGGINTYVIEDGVPSEHLAKPFFVTSAMKDNLLNFILHLQEQGTPPTCLVSDSFVPWTAPVAQQVGIPRIEFWTSNALSYVLNLNVPALCDANIFPERGPSIWKSESPLMLDCIPCLPPISSELYPTPIRFDEEPSPFRALFKEVCSAVKLSERILIYTLSELELDAFRGLRAMGLSACPIGGPLLHYNYKNQEAKQAHESTLNSTSFKQNEEPKSLDCLSWLDTQAESSVIYVAFGTVAKLSVQDIEELARGLEASGNPFLWAVRDASHGTVKSGMRGKGMVTSWAPQVDVLAHKAIGGFLTHCGWNSTVESLWEGVPMLCCPQFGDQRSNMWCMRELWGTGLELERTDTGGLRRAYVEAGVRALLQGEEGRAARKRAEEMKHRMREACQEGGESFSNLQKLYDDMMKAFAITKC